MKLYKVKEGTIGTVYPPGKRTKSIQNFATRKDLTFEDHEMIFDPVALHNGRLKKASNFCKMMAKKGFAGFRRKNWLLVVEYKKVHILG